MWLWVASVRGNAFGPWAVLGTLLKETKSSRELCRGLSKWVTWLVCDLQLGVEIGGMSQVRQRLGGVGSCCMGKVTGDL